jgi:7-cyano-7-deazaguanine synthase
MKSKAYEEGQRNMSKSDVIPSSMGFSAKQPDSCAIVSGGLDSTVLVYDMLDKGYTPHMLSFDYGQRHKKELWFAANTAVRLGLKHDIIDLAGITSLISNSALTSPIDGTGPRQVEALRGGDPIGTHRMIEVPEGHYAEETMKATVVPNRNMIMLSIAAGVAVNNRYRRIGIGVHGGDHFIYPDCRPEFIDHIADAVVKGNEGFHNFERNPESVLDEPILAPYLNSTKADIAYRGLELNVPFEMTWSCYKGGDKHCGKCGTCVERLEAISEARHRFEGEGNPDQTDQTEYQDTNFWRKAVADLH